MRSSVVLPAPFGPHNPTRSRAVICQVTWSNRTRSPNAFVSSDSWIMLTINHLVYHTHHEDLKHTKPFVGWDALSWA